MTSKAARFITQLMAGIAERDARIAELEAENRLLEQEIFQQPSAGLVLPERMTEEEIHAVDMDCTMQIDFALGIEGHVRSEFIRLNPCRAQAVQICKLGMYGAAYDAPDTCRAYTYAAQPGNDIAYRLGDCLRATHCDGGGDFIDFGLALLRRLQDKGFGVFQIAAAPSANKESGDE